MEVDSAPNPVRILRITREFCKAERDSSKPSAKARTSLIGQKPRIIHCAAGDMKRYYSQAIANLMKLLTG